MCGILFSTHPNGADNFKNIAHRGPDSSTLIQKTYQKFKVTIGFHRLSITGVKLGDQPFFDKEVYVICNGEIYNYEDLIDRFNLKCQTKSDCEVILRLYLLKRNHKYLHLIQGEFAYIIFDMKKGKVFYSRDGSGVRPLYISWQNGYITLASELRGLPGIGKQVIPGAMIMYDISTDTTISNKNRIPFISATPDDIKKALIQAVRDRVRSEVPIGFLLSGGFDSSIILSIASDVLPITTKIDVFTFGFDENAPDVINAKKVIEFLNEKYPARYNHTIVIGTFEQGIVQVPKVIKAISSYDTTTVRASVPMYMIAKFIKERTNIRVLISGEGSDEINGSYLYFHYAPSFEEFQQERERLHSEIHLYDGLRADRVVSAWSLELRVPFLDEKVVRHTLGCKEVYSSMKMTKVEKFAIRTVFNGYLPNEVLWRTKAAFSDAVSYGWKEALKDHAKSLCLPDNPTTHLPPTSDEEKWYRHVFDKHYPGQENVITHMWLPKWVETNGEPSATILPVHDERMQND